MGMRWNGAADRRREQRVCSTGTAMVHARGRAIATRVEDLSLGGASLIAVHRHELRGLKRARTRISLRLDGTRNHWFHASGRASRVDGSRRRLTIRFTAVPADFEDMIQDELVGALEHEQSSCVVVIVDRSDGRRDAIGDALRLAGCRVIDARTPLETLYRLDESKLHPDVVAIADTQPAGEAADLRRFLHRTYPELAMMGIGTRSTRAHRFTVDGIADLPVQVSRFLAERRAHG